MSNISSYPLITPKAGDLILVTETYDVNAVNPVKGNPTRSATVASIMAVDSSYYVYTALVSQTGTSDPTVVVLENNTGATMVWTRKGTGDYDMTVTGLTMTNANTIVFVNNGGRTGLSENIAWNIHANSVDISTVIDGAMDNSSFEVRIYK
jgi:hypothetical protein